jgi:hypothetical protein
MVRADDDVRDRLWRDFPDLGDEPFGFGDAALSVGDQDARRRGDEQRDGGELLGPRRAQLLVGVRDVAQLADAGEIGVGVAALVRVAGADGLGSCRPGCATSGAAASVARIAKIGSE